MIIFVNHGITYQTLAKGGGIVITSLAGRFYRLYEYGSNEELLKLLLQLIDLGVKEKETYFRFYHNPYDLELSVIGYFAPNDKIVMIFLKNDKPVGPNESMLDSILKSSHGFIEIYKLTRHECEIDREIIFQSIRVLGESPEKYILRVDVGVFQEKLMTLHNTASEHDAFRHPGKSGTLIYSPDLSLRLEDETYRANILMRRDYRFMEIDTDMIANTLHNIFSEGKNVVVIIKIGSTSIWLIKDSGNRIGFRVFGQPENLDYKIRTYDELIESISSLVSKQGASGRKARIIVYEI